MLRHGFTVGFYLIISTSRELFEVIWNENAQKRHRALKEGGKGGMDHVSQRGETVSQFTFLKEAT